MICIIFLESLFQSEREKTKKLETSSLALGPVCGNVYV